MKYILQINDIGGYLRFYAGAGEITPRISEAFTFNNARSARRESRRGKYLGREVIVRAITDKELFTARLAGK